MTHAFALDDLERERAHGGRRKGRDVNVHAQDEVC
jgi:hypothetical protein